MSLISANIVRKDEVPEEPVNGDGKLIAADPASRATKRARRDEVVVDEKVRSVHFIYSSFPT